MYTCPNCHVDIYPQASECPLCGGPLRPTRGGTPDKDIQEAPSALPRENTISGISARSGPRRKLAIIALIGILDLVLSLIGRIILPAAGWWLVYVVCAAPVILGTALNKKYETKNLARHVTYASCYLIALALIADRFIGLEGYAKNYVYPILACVSLVGIVINAFQIRRENNKDYLMFLILNAVSAVVSGILLLTGVITVMLPALVYIIATAVLVVGFIFFEHHNLLQSFKRQVHI